MCVFNGLREFWLTNLSPQIKGLQIELQTFEPEMSRPRISAFIFTCLSCRWQRIWPLEHEPSADVVVRAKEKAKSLECERCHGGGELEVFWTNGWHGDQLARQVAHIEAKNQAATSAPSSL